MAASNSFEALLDALGASFDFAMGDASGHLTERVAAASTTVETALTYGIPGLREVPGTAVKYNGTTSTTTAPSNSAFDLGDVLSLMVVFRMTAISVGAFIDRGHTTGNAYFLYIDNAGHLIFGDSTSQFSGDILDSGTTAITDTTTTHALFVTKNGATRHMYIDGVAQAVAGTNVTLGNSTSVFTLGTTNLNAIIYRATGWKTELTAAQVAAVSFAALAPGYLNRPVLIPERIHDHPNFRHIPLVQPPSPSGPIANQSTLTASLSFTGSLTKQTAHGMTGGLSFTGTLTKAIAHILPAGGLSFTGSLTRRTGKALTAGLSFTGSISRQVGKALTAGLSFAGSLPRAITRGLTATLTFNGALTKRTAHILPGATLTFNGALATLKAFGVTLTASLSFNGSLTRRPGKALTASLGFAGALPRAISHGMSASVSFTGSLPRRTSRTLTASLSFTGSVTKSLRRTLTGALSFAGSVVATFHSGAGSIGGIVRGTASAVHAIPTAVISHLRPDGGANRATPSGGASHPTPSGDADHEVPR